MPVPRSFDGAVEGYRYVKKPTSLKIPSADSTLHVRNIRWRRWGGKRATGKAKYAWCEVFCAPSTRWDSFTLQASARKIKCGRRYYSVVKERFGDSGSWSAMRALYPVNGGTLDGVPC